ncbi:unnamed protein product [Adineta steineri]|uniref:Uncharacterized protein n=1 Tax=Adineta steineri TaxID=433720 RepID=A0A819LRZ5_9BILA|nr:unnamed protein product [Adineta steineri]CAF1249202.1 unnamed protein product [Adineta steineri]CAF3931714.1 unnamed protein product [Adineta steineri]CAF3965219.1 unnamed protein product [Adineta steineri]
MILFVNSSPTSTGNSHQCYKDQTTNGTCKVDYACYDFCRRQSVLNPQNLPPPFNSALGIKLIDTTGLCHSFCKFGTCYCFLTPEEVTAMLSEIGVDTIDPTDTVVSTCTKINGKEISASTLICGNPTMTN